MHQFKLFNLMKTALNFVVFFEMKFHGKFVTIQTVDIVKDMSRSDVLTGMTPSFITNTFWFVRKC